MERISESLVTSINALPEIDQHDSKYSVLYGYDLDQFEYERKKVDALVIDSIKETIFRMGYGKAMRRAYPDTWEEKFVAAVGRSNTKLRETDKFKQSVQNALQHLRDLPEQDIYDRFLTRFEYRYMNRLEVITKIRPMLQPHITSGRMLNYAQTLVTLMLDYQWNAEARGERDFYIGYNNIMAALPIFKNKLDITKVMPFIVAGFRSDKLGVDLNREPVFQCIEKASNLVVDGHRSEKATIYRLNDSYRFLLEL